MAKEEMKPEEGKGGKKKKLHFHQLRQVAAHDGTVVSHHTYKNHKDDHFTMPERENAATHQTPEEAGQHSEEMFAQNDQGADQGGQQAPEEAAAGAQPMAGAGGDAGAPAAGV